MYDVSIFIFRRDLRLSDNIGLMKALKESKVVVPVFIFTPEQLIKNKYKSDNAVQFMMESLEDLDKDLRGKNSRLFYFFGTPHGIINKLITKLDADAVYVNMDYTVYSTERDIKISEVCKKHDIELISSEDYLFHPVGSVRTGSDTVYTKFTPYFNKAKSKKVPNFTKNSRSNYYSKTKDIVGEFKGKKDKFYKYNDSIAVNGGRDNALKILRGIKQFKSYNKDRNTLHMNTTRLSAYIKFGNVSIREVYHVFKDKLGGDNDLIKQLFWREFYFNISYYYPHTLGKLKTNRNFNKKYNKVSWMNLNKATVDQKKKWTAWVEGETGYPAVDACMRELNETGYMHNRGRLIVASFLTKNLMWNWEDGEMYFSNKLIDYDPSVNNGNWQWVSSSGVDSQPYFRVFNPWTQSERFDKETIYIKHWIPELKDVPAKHIHKWNEYWEEYDDVDYPEPIVDHSKTRENAIKKYKKALT
jgi:deoxyribodipyrimidine photo-lyase